MSYLFGDVATWLVGKKYSDEDEEITNGQDQQNKEKREVHDDRENSDNKEKNIEKDEATKNEEEQGVEESVGTSLEKDFEEVSTLAYNKAVDLGSYIFNLGKSYSKQVAQTAQNLKDVIEEKTLLGDFSKEQEKFVTTNKGRKAPSDTSVAPWVGYNEEEAMKKQILDLSKDKRNLLRDPPTGIQFAFDFDANYPLALTMLQLDPTLNSLRFKLVPKQIKEEVFWRNYFYRVSLIKQSTQLSSLNTPSEAFKSEAKKAASSNISHETEVDKESKSEVDAEFVSDSFNNDHLGDDDDDLYNALQQLNTKEEEEATSEDKETGEKKKEKEEEEEEEGENDGEVAEWEAELQAELREYEVVGNGIEDEDILQQLNEEAPHDAAAAAVAGVDAVANVAAVGAVTAVGGVSGVGGDGVVGVDK